mgnify:CR=1 FL=1
MDTFAQRFITALQSRNITAAELSRRLGVNEGTISNYKKGTYEPKQRRLEAIAKILNVSIPWLMGADVPMEPSATIPTGFSLVPDTVMRPRLGRISCGIPIMSEENFDGYDEVPKHIDCDFTLVCDGDSMTGARILDGDIVYIKQQPMVENGEIAAVLVDGCEKLLKRVYITETSITLQAENPKYSPLIFIREDMNRVSIIGKAVAFTSVVR